MDLNQLEKQAYSSRFRDGLREMYIGALMLSMGLIPLMERWGVHRFLGYILFIGLPMIAFFIIERRVVKARIGFARYGPARRKKLALLPMLIVVGVTLTFGLFALTVAGRFPGEFSHCLNGWLTPLLISFIALAIFSVIGYFLDNTRFYLIGLLLAGSLFLSDALYGWWDAPWRELVIFGLSGGIVLAMGAVSFRRFLKETQTMKGQYTMEGGGHGE